MVDNTTKNQPKVEMDFNFNAYSVLSDLNQELQIGVVKGYYNQKRMTDIMISNLIALNELVLAGRKNPCQEKSTDPKESESVEIGKITHNKTQRGQTEVLKVGVQEIQL